MNEIWIYMKNWTTFKQNYRKQFDMKFQNEGVRFSQSSTFFPNFSFFYLQGWEWTTWTEQNLTNGMYFNLKFENGRLRFYNASSHFASPIIWTGRMNKLWEYLNKTEQNLHKTMACISILNSKVDKCISTTPGINLKRSYFWQVGQTKFFFLQGEWAM